MVDFSVSGNARQSAPAELGTARLRVRVEGADRATVFDTAVAAHDLLSREAAAHVASGAATIWTADQVFVAGVRHWDHATDSNITLQTASALVTVTFVDFDALSMWLGTIGQREGAEIEGIDWEVAEAHLAEIQREVRIGAVRDAESRAAGYAEALGLQTVELVALWEPGLRFGGRPDPAGGTRAMSLSSRGEPELRLSPERIEIAAAVSADFRAL